MINSVDKELNSSFLLRLIGYCLLGLALVDIIALLLPPRLMDPVWEFQTIGSIVEHLPVPLLGLGLVFYRASDLRSKWEQLPLKFLSWASFGAGVLLLLLIPLLGVNSARLNNQINNQVSTQINPQLTQQMSKLEQIQQQLVKANTAQDINNVIVSFHLQGVSPNSDNPQQLKSQILSEINSDKKTLQSQIKLAGADKHLALIKNLVKWILGALVAGVLFIYIWKLTRWARLGSKRSG